jgi:hypothetical protein
MDAALDAATARDAAEIALKALRVGARHLEAEALDEIADVVAATDAALCGVTSGAGDRRPVLALTSVLAEILKESAVRIPRPQIEAAAIDALDRVRRTRA